MQKLDLIDYLNIEFKLRKEKNNNYSLRAFAKNLNVQPATLSHVLKRKRKPSKSFQEKIFEALKISQEQRDFFESSNKGEWNNSALDIDTFISISEWYYDAIIELVRVKNFESSAEYVAKKLGLNKKVAQEAIRKLFELDILKEAPNKKWVETEGNSSILGGEETNIALQKLQKQLLEKGIEAIYRVPKKRREQLSMTMAINENDLPEAKKRIKEFHRGLCEYLQRPQRELGEVYQLTSSLFPLTEES